MSSPSMRSQPGPNDGPAPDPEAEPGAARRGLVWIVDDSRLELERVTRTLAGICDIETFSEGTAVLERLAHGGSPDTLVLDWTLPGPSGLEICRFIRSTTDEVALPVLMLTVQGNKHNVIEALEAGANDYVTKPYDGAELIARVSTLVRTKRLHEMVQAERARADEANRSKDLFLAMVSHEIRSPLSAILGWAEMLGAGELKESDRTRAVATIERNARSASQLVGDLLNMSSILNGKLRLELRRVHLAHAVAEGLDSIRPLADAKGVRVEPSIDVEAGTMQGDPERLQQVVWNLLTNAVKFTPAGGTVRVTVRRAGGKVELVVTDTGSGISPEFLPHIFERFRQADEGASKRQGGLGLGLTISHYLIGLHSGTIHAMSDGPGKGATFVVRFPLVMDAAPSAVPPEGASAPL